MQQKKLVIFIGPPGSGKGTLSQMCVDRLGCRQLSTGQLCRKHIAQGTEIGARIDFAIKSGKLISDELIVDMVYQWLVDNISYADCIILDGFPRTVGQAEVLDQLLSSMELNLDLIPVIVWLQVADEVVLDRLAGRVMCSNDDCQAVYSLKKDSGSSPRQDMVCNYCQSPISRRSDDEVEVIKNRLVAYHQYQGALISYYRDNQYDVYAIDANAPSEHVFNELKKIL